MKIIAKNTKVLPGSFKWNEEKTEVKFQANTELAVEGNKYSDRTINGDVKDVANYLKPVLVTPVTLFDLVCSKNDFDNIDEIAQAQAQAWVNINYPEF